MSKIFNVKPFINKNTKQISFVIPKKEFKIPKDKIPKNFKFRIEEILWED